MKQNQKFDERFEREALTYGYRFDAACSRITHQPIDAVVEVEYTTRNEVQVRLRMAFVRRKGNTFYLVHNVRHGGKVQQLHLACLGKRARITDQVVRQVSKKHPFIELNWRSLREQLNGRLDLADPDSPMVQQLIANLRVLNMDLADVFPPVFRISESQAVAQELLLQLRLLQSTLEVKLDQFDRSGVRFGNVSRLMRGARRRS